MNQEIQKEFLDLFTLGSAKILISRAAELMCLHVQLRDYCFQLAETAKDPVRWRAAWALSVYFEDESIALDDKLHAVVQLVLNSPSVGVRRSMLHVLIPRAHELGLHTGSLIEFCYNTLLNINKSFAERVYSIQMLNQITLLIPELREEFILTLHMLRQQTEGSILAQINKILDQKPRKKSRLKLEIDKRLDSF